MQSKWTVQIIQLKYITVFDFYNKDIHLRLKNVVCYFVIILACSPFLPRHTMYIYGPP